MADEEKRALPGSTGGDMTFLDHLGELRDRLIKIVLAVLLMMAISFVYSNTIIKWLLYPPMIIPDLKPPIQLMRPVITQVQGLMMVKIQVGLIAGIVLSIPVIAYQLWRFISPALKKSEKRFAIPLIFFITFFFLLGATFAYLVVIPITLNFLLSMGNIDTELGIVVENMIDVDQYLSFVSGFMLISGATFEMPVIAFFLAKIGILSPQFMREYWRHAAVACLLVSAVITPTTDMITMFVVAAPMVVLYEMSIWVAKFATRKKKSDEKHN
ncbi:MAG TPA: twin-arginine translocase subunit TatC [bacterium]|nr:twin-arginine translocase subunit TatC [bacterium]HMW36027.1 twin-arginine translocase subunit TatC [bacterium]HMY36902.1 twin-arginine translocase subunit TatC [bacterium]HMZ04269.1 twin-arginine translocase subunit TatC [bacterium]HNB58336.1 twin-arginine translocase subunit TatC [bacterium]